MRIQQGLRQCGLHITLCELKGFKMIEKKRAELLSAMKGTVEEEHSKAGGNKDL